MKKLFLSITLGLFTLFSSISLNTPLNGMQPGYIHVSGQSYQPKEESPKTTESLSKDLGTISAETKQTIKLPKEGGSTEFYSWTPITGEAKGRKIYLEFEKKVQPKESPLSSPTSFMIFRKFEGQRHNDAVRIGNII